MNSKINKITIRKLVDYILLNAYSIDSSGFYNGKAGIALVLFEVSNYLQDEYVENQAFDLLREALLSKTEDISFENGLSGIGYVLLFLIDNKIIDANFEELFNLNHLRIKYQLKNKIKQKDTCQLSSFLKTVYYFSIYNKKYIDKDCTFIIESLVRYSGSQLISSMKMIEQGKYIFPKISILNSFECYLKIINNCISVLPNIKLLDLYLDLYSKNNFISDYSIGYYLSKIGERIDEKNIIFVGEENKRVAAQNIYPNTLTLSQKIVQLYLMRQYKKDYEQEIKNLEQGIMNSNNEILEQQLLNGFCFNEFIAGYKSGLARFLLYWIYANKSIKSASKLLDL